MTSVIIVGAGAAGITAARTLLNSGRANVIILEANSILGGRIKKVDAGAFVNFPIDLGAQWITPTRSGDTATRILQELANGGDVNGDVTVTQQTIRHDYDPALIWDGDEFYETNDNLRDHLWINYTWFDFFDQYMATEQVKELIQYNCVVNQIEYELDTSSNQEQSGVRVTCQNNRSFEADYVLVTVSIKILQSGDIAFTPSLPSEVSEALNQYRVGEGIKIFIEFQSNFYPNAFYFGENDFDLSPSERFFWSESFGEGPTAANVLGILALGELVKAYDRATSEAELLAILEDEIDTMFGLGTFASNYIQHYTQNWQDEPFVRSAYTLEVAGDATILFEPVGGPDGRLYFAGDSLPTDLSNWGYVHEAARSGRAAAKSILGAGSSASAARWRYISFVVVVFHMVLLSVVGR